MHTRIPPTASPRQTSYAPATGMPPLAHQVPAAEPAQAAGAGAVRVPRRAREDDDKSSSSSSCSSSSSTKAGPLARRAQPLTASVTSAPGHPFAYNASAQSLVGFRSVCASSRGGVRAPAPQARPSRVPPDAVLARIAAFVPDPRPQAYLAGLRKTLRGPGAVASEAQDALLGLRPEALLEQHPDFRTLADWRRYFRAGGTLDKVPGQERGPECFRAAVEADPAAIRRVPPNRRTPAFLEDLLRRNGMALAHLRLSMLVPGAPNRERLVHAALSSPHLPRIRHVPADLLTADRCARLLASHPRDLVDAPEHLLTEGMCVAAIGAIQDGSFHATWARIPMRLRGAAVADAMADYHLREPYTNPPDPSDFLPAAGTSRGFKNLMALQDKARFLRDGGGSTSLRELASFCVKLPHHDEEFALETVVAAIQAAARRSGVRLDRPVTLPVKDGDMTLDDLGEQSILRWALTHHGDWMHLAPDRIRHDAELCRCALASGKFGMEDIPFEVIQAHPDIALQVMRRTEPDSPGEPEFDPLAPISKEVWALFDRATTEGLCRDILPRFGNAVASLRELEPGLLTDDMYALAATGGCPLALIPERLRPALQAVSVLKLADNLREIPESERTLALCELAIARDPQAWAFVPARYLCAELGDRAITVAADYLGEWIDQYGDRLPDRFLLRAVAEGGAAPHVLPPRLRSARLYQLAIRRNPTLMQSLHAVTEAWAPILTSEMLQEDGARIRFLLPEQVTPERIALAYQHGATRDDLMTLYDNLGSQKKVPAQVLMAEFESMVNVPEPAADD